MRLQVQPWMVSDYYTAVSYNLLLHRRIVYGLAFIVTIKFLTETLRVGGGGELQFAYN